MTHIHFNICSVHSILFVINVHARKRIQLMAGLTPSLGQPQKIVNFKVIILNITFIESIKSF